jgi:hypothetical protein
MDDIETLEPEDLRTGRARIARRSDGPVELVVKTATGGDRATLRREAEVLRAVGGVDVVQVVDMLDGDDRTELVLRDTGGPSLAAALATAPTSADALLLLADACDVVVRLHARGWAHGRITADHVLLTRRGRMRLCSLGAATPVESAPATARADRAALLRMVDDWTRAPAGPGRAAGLGARLRALVLARRTLRLPDDPDPRVLARILRRTARGRAPSPRSLLRVMPLVAVVVLGALVVGWLSDADTVPSPTASGDDAAGASSTALATTSTSTTTTSSDVPSRAATALPTSSTAPPTTEPPVTLPAATEANPTTYEVDGNTVTAEGRRFRVGEPGDVVVVSDWDCDGVPTAAVLRPSTGAVHVFDEWASPGATATATEVDRVAGAVAIGPPAGRCGPPVVRTWSGATRPLELDELEGEVGP